MGEKMCKFKWVEFKWAIEMTDMVVYIYSNEGKKSKVCLEHVVETF